MSRDFNNRSKSSRPGGRDGRPGEKRTAGGRRFAAAGEKRASGDRKGSFERRVPGERRGPARSAGASGHRVFEPRRAPEAPITVPSIPDEERLEGRNAVTEALDAGRPFNKVWYLKPLPDKKMDGRLGEILARFKGTDTVLYPVDRKTLDRMAVTPSHQGIIAQVAAHRYAEIDEMLALAEAKGEAPFLILLDQIQDSQNLGAIMRTADAVGAHGIIIPRRRSVALDAAAAKASAGAIEHVLCARVTNLNRTIQELKEKEIWVAGLGMGGEDLFSSAKFNMPIALVVGSEGDGLSQSVAENCDFIVGIPMRGTINSLNASNAAAVAMYEVLRQRLSGKK